MFNNEAKKKAAINLRKTGKTYSEILGEVNVAKSTLSLWLRDIDLSKRQIQKLSQKKILGQRKGALVRKNNRIELQRSIYRKSKSQVGKLTDRELWLIGATLYWAEGSKEKEYRPGSGIKFSNSDPKMVTLFLKWLAHFCGVGKEQIIFDIYIHETYKNRLDQIRKYWSEVTGFSQESFSRIYFKKHNIKTKRRNVGILYNGVLRVNVRASSELNRKITGWIMGICES